MKQRMHRQTISFLTAMGGKLPGLPMTDRGHVMKIVFDMDGVILDTERMVIDCWLSVGPKYGITDLEQLEQVCRNCIGTNRAKTEELFLEVYGWDFPYGTVRNETDAMIHRIRETDGIPVKKGAKELLAALRQSGAQIGLASSTRYESVKRELQDAGVWEYFSTVVTGDMVTGSKPKPDIYLEACHRMGAIPADTYAVEDSYNGVRSAAAAGMKVLMVPDLLKPTDEISNLCVGVFEDLTKVWEKLQKEF